MSTTESNKHIEQWIHLDNQLKLIHTKTKELRERKNKLEQDIITNASDHVPNNKMVQIFKVKETQPLTFRHLESCLGDIFSNKEQVTKIIDYIKNKREIKYVSELRQMTSR